MNVFTQLQTASLWRYRISIIVSCLYLIFYFSWFLSYEVVRHFLIFLKLLPLTLFLFSKNLIPLERKPLCLDQCWGSETIFFWSRSDFSDHFGSGIFSTKKFCFKMLTFILYWKCVGPSISVNFSLKYINKIEIKWLLILKFYDFYNFILFCIFILKISFRFIQIRIRIRNT